MKIINYLFKFLLVVLVALQPVFAQLSVSPKRVIFENRERSHELLLINTGDKTKKYRIHFKQLEMTADGGYQNLSDATDAQHLLASKAVRFSPRQVTLKPGMTQTIRLLLRKPKGFSDGEYRSHLTFSEVPDESEGLGLQQPEQSDGFAFQMRPLLGMSIPIIVRQGKLSQSVEIRNPELTNKALHLKLHRLGQASVYGKITATFTPANQGAPIEVGEIKGVSVLTPLQWRSVELPLTTNVKALGKGELTITYSNLEENSAKKQPILFKQQLTL